MSKRRIRTQSWQRRTDGDGADSATWANRADRGALLKAVTRADGTMLLEGYAAREGVLEYPQADGTVRRELVPMSTLRDSAAGLGRAPATLEHPRVNVTPDNVAEYGVGDTDGDVLVEDGGFVRVRLAVRRRDAIAAVQSGRKVELSPGYMVQTDETPGTHPVHGRYDAVQVARRYNHLAIVERARGGSEVRMRVDGVDCDVSTTLIERRDAVQERTMNPRLAALLAQLGIRQVVHDDANAIALLEDHLRGRADSDAASAKERNDALAAAVTERDAAKAASVAATAAMAVEKARADTASAELATLKAAEQARSDAEERTVLEGLARAVRIDAKVHADNGALKRAIVAAHLPETKADAADAYIDAAVDIFRARVDADNARDAARSAWTAPATQRTDAAVPAQRRLSPGQASLARYQAATAADAK